MPLFKKNNNNNLWPFVDGREMVPYLKTMQVKTKGEDSEERSSCLGDKNLVWTWRVLEAENWPVCVCVWGTLISYKTTNSK